MRFSLALLLVFALARVASAAPDPCAKFADADAYNNCLAGAGPVARSHKLGRAPEQDLAARPSKKHARAVRRPVPKAWAPRERRAGRKSNGRVRVEIFR
jgi:hypothetical protein